MRLSHVLRLVLFVAFAMPVSAGAQWLKAYGVKAGINSSDASIKYQNSDFEVKTQKRAGFDAAFFFEWGKSPVLSVITQAEYVQRGFIQEQDEGSPVPKGILRSSARLDYVSVPVMIKLQLPSLMSGPYVVFGPRADFLVNRAGGRFTGGDLKSALHEVFEDRAFGGTVGLGFDTEKLARLPLLVEARYDFDFTENSGPTLWRAKNKAFDFYLGIKF